VLFRSGPGLIILIPYIERMVRVDLRVVTLDVPKQDTMTRDNVPVAVDAVVYFQVVDPAAAIIKVESFVRATALISQTNLRSTIGQSELDEILANRDEINARLQRQLDAQTEPWGVKVNMVEIRDVVLPEGMRRAMARQAEVERERRAKIINAEGEFQAAARLLEAADTMSQNPVTIQLRYMQTVAEIATENNSTIVFPLPVDLLRPLLGAGGVEYPPRPMPPMPKDFEEETGHRGEEGSV
jgi:regulator of protease activity HflC (stomatin/prohibitin superfamily)